MIATNVESEPLRVYKYHKVSKVRNIRLDDETNTMIENLRSVFSGVIDWDIPSISVIVRRAILYYGRAVKTMPEEKLEGERTFLKSVTVLKCKGGMSNKAKYKNRVFLPLTDDSQWPKRVKEKDARELCSKTQRGTVPRLGCSLLVTLEDGRLARLERFRPKKYLLHRHPA